MSESAPAIAEKPTVKVEVPKIPSIPITTPALDHAKVTGAIANNLNKIGHSVSAEEISAHASGNAVLTDIEKQGIGAKVADVLDPLHKLVENTAGDLGGTHRTYLLSRGVGLQTTQERMVKRTRFSGVAEKMSNLLSFFKKK